jgi:hypothetical protein
MLAVVRGEAERGGGLWFAGDRSIVGGWTSWLEVVSVVTGMGEGLPWAVWALPMSGWTASEASVNGHGERRTDTP